MSIFPMISPPAGTEAGAGLPLCREAAWNFEKNPRLAAGGAGDRHWQRGGKGMDL